MNLRRISPPPGFNSDKNWTRWEKWGKNLITYPQPTAQCVEGGRLSLAPALRFREDGLIYNPATDELFQADSEMLDVLKRLHDSPDQTSEQVLQSGIRMAAEAGILVSAAA